jgi:hypothetical protein
VQIKVLQMPPPLRSDFARRFSAKHKCDDWGRIVLSHPPPYNQFDKKMFKTTNPAKHFVLYFLNNYNTNFTLQRDHLICFEVLYPLTNAGYLAKQIFV